MSYTIPNKYLILAIGLLILGIFFGGWYIGATKDKNALNTTIEAQKKEIQRMSVEINDTEYQVTKVEQELMTEKELRKQDIFEKKELKALGLKQANEISRLKLRIDTLLEDITHDGQIITILNSQITNIDNNIDTMSMLHQKAILLPFTFEKTDKWLSLKGRFNEEGKLGIDLSMGIEVNAVSGIDKNKKPILNLYTDNPYLRTISIASYKTDVPKPKKYGMGVSAGYAICRSGLSPFVGVGLSYSIISF
jgi:hypothetical protein